MLQPGLFVVPETHIALISAMYLTFVINSHSFRCIISCVKMLDVRYTLEEQMFMYDSYVESDNCKWTKTDKDVTGGKTNL